MNGIRTLFFGTNRDQWVQLKLNDLCVRITSGGTPSRRVPTYYIDGIYPWVKTQELCDTWINDTEEHITPEAIVQSSAKILPKNTVLIAMYGATVGKLGLLRQPMACNQACCALIVDDKKADYRFIFYQLLQNRDHLRNLATGAAQQNLSGEVIKSLKFWIPPLPEQHRIAHILGTLDDKIENNRKTAKTLEAMAQAIFQSWFVDFDPVRAKMAGESKESICKRLKLTPEILDLFPDRLVDSELGEIPEGWEVTYMRSLAEVISKGTTPTKDDLANALDKPTIPFIKVKDIVRHWEINRNSLDFIAKSINETSLKRSILKADDLLFSIAGTIGRSAFIDEDLVGANINQAIAFIRLKDKQDNFFLCLMNLRSAGTQTFIAAKVVQAVQANTSLTDIGNIPVILPSHDVLSRWNGFIYSIISEYRHHQHEVFILVKLRDILLPKLISGEIRVPEAKHLIQATMERTK